MRNGEIMKESFGIKPYITKFNITQARTKLKYMTKMLQHDAGPQDVLWCPSNQKLRQNKNQSNQLAEVIKIRNNLEII